MDRYQKTGTAPLLRCLSHRKTQSSQDQQFEDRRRIAERLVQDLARGGLFVRTATMTVTRGC